MLISNITRNLLLSFLVIFVGVLLGAQKTTAGESGSFFSQGQAVYNAQDLAKSQQEALQDLMVQGVTQALASLLSPSQMGSNYPAIQSKILKQPERYIESYQIFSESPAGSLYRITGQVNVSMDTLKSDVNQLGLTLSETPGTAPTPPATPEQTGQLAEPPASLEPVPPLSEQSPQQAERIEPAPSPEQRVLWAVAERWNENWILPENSADPRCLFVMSVLQESQDYPWSLNFPQSPSLIIDPSGNVSREQILPQAKSAGFQSLIVGTIFSRQDGGEQPMVEASLQVIDVASGQSKGEIRKEVPMAGSTYQEGAMKMAYLLVPQLDRLLRGGSSAVLTPPDMASGGGWTLLIHSSYPYLYWEELEQVLRDRFTSMQVTKLQVSRDVAQVQVEGLGADFFNMLQDGIQLRDGTRMQLGAYSAENRSVELSPVRF